MSLALHLDTLHLIAQGRAERLRGETDLRRASRVVLEVPEWPTTVLGGEAAYAAPESRAGTRPAS